MTFLFWHLLKYFVDTIYHVRYNVTTLTGDIDMKSDYEYWNNYQVSKFLSEMCDVGGDSKIDGAGLHEAYMNWTKGKEYLIPLSRNSLTRSIRATVDPRLTTYGAHRLGTETFRGFRGIALKQNVGNAQHLQTSCPTCGAPVTR